MWVVYLALDMLVAPYSIAKAQLGKQTAMACRLPAAAAEMGGTANWWAQPSSMELG
jgi:hypothetical protein